MEAALVMHAAVADLPCRPRNHPNRDDLPIWTFDRPDQVHAAEYTPFELTLGKDARIIGRVAQRITRYL